MEYMHARVSALGNVNDDRHLEKLSATKEQRTHTVSVVDIVNGFHDTLRIGDNNSEAGSDLPSDDSVSSGSQDETLTNDGNINLDGAQETSSRCLQKCATFPVAVGAEKALDFQSGSNCCARSFSLPTAHKLVSAMKGSREKEGVPPRKLSVSWAPDVYDPLPTSLSHLPKKKYQQRLKSSKKHIKGKQKSKNMRGGGSVPKDKKHCRKTGGKSDRCLASYTDCDRVMPSNSYKSSIELLDFDVRDDGIGIPESNCGSSYLGNAGGTLHFAVAEAT